MKVPMTVVNKNSGKTVVAQSVSTVVILALLGTVLGYGLSAVFPRAEVWLSDWQVANTVSKTVNDSIVLVTLEEEGPVSCGMGRWNSAIVAQTISALTQAKAKIIAPALHFAVPNTSECGDVLGHAKLIEATKQADNVIYPSSAPESLAHEARAVGKLELKSDEDGIFRRVQLPSADEISKEIPLGMSISSVLSGESSEAPATELRVPFGGQSISQSFQTYSFPRIWDLVHQRDHQGLSELVHEKVVILFPIGISEPTLATPWDAVVPLGVLHATLLQAGLSQSWLTHLSVITGSVVTLAFSVMMAWLFLRSPGRQTWVFVGLLILGYVGLTQIFLYTGEQIWPLLAPMVAFTMTSAGAAIWTVYQSRIRAAHHIQDVTAQFTVLQEKLVGKESVVEQLEEELEQAKVAAHESTQKYEQVTASAEHNQARLDAAQTEVDATRQRLQELQQELDGLQKAAPARPITTLPLADDNLDQLRKECESFDIVTCDVQVVKIFQDLKKAAGTTSPILILGETGTGKELFAKAAHHLSPRARAPFVSVNMAAIRPELFESELFGHVKGAFTGAIGRRGFLESADHGTLFLDEIGELPLDLQAKLLRVLEDGTFYRVGQSSPTKIDVRIVAATNRDLAQEVQEGRYREDFYYRLRSIVLRLPPLREREPEDRRLLAHQFTQEFTPQEQERLKLSEGALEAIQAYSWPGNIRELRQIIAQAVALGEGAILSEEDLRLPSLERERAQPYASETESYEGDAKREMARREDAMVLSFLRQNKFDMQATAKALNWDRGTVTQRLKGMGFQALVEHNGNVKAAAEALAGNPTLIKLVELKLRGYQKNLLPSTKQYQSEDHAIEDCRKRFRNLPDRHFPSVETLIRQHFANSGQ